MEYLILLKWYYKPLLEYLSYTMVQITFIVKAG